MAIEGYRIEEVPDAKPKLLSAKRFRLVRFSYPLSYQGDYAKLSTAERFWTMLL